MEIKEKIKQELNRCIFVCDSVLYQTDTSEEVRKVYECKKSTYEHMLQFINSLPDESSINKDQDLRQEAIKYLEKQQGKEFNSTSEEQCLRVYAFEDGARWQEQKMIRDIVKGEYWDSSIYFDDRPVGYEDGKEVSVVIIKES